jgi:dihydrofolate synthase / folylpolyglutamate synthase
VTYQEALAWLYGTQRFGIKLGLENVQRLLRERDVPGKDQRIIHVAGTNGKGSVCAMIDSICRAAGFRSALFTSPHLITYRERIRVNGEMITPDEVARGLSGIRELVKTWDPHPTFFEITTALALDHFKRAGCELIVLETGLGGRLDATNALTPLVSVITPIAYDHEKWLGNTLEAIAGEKAGIIKGKVPAVSAQQEPGAEKVIRSRAAECEAPLEFVAAVCDRRMKLGLTGKHQQENAALAIAALRLAGVTVPEDAIERGLANVEWPARFQRWDDRIVIDGAHNPAGARVLAEAWRSEFASHGATIILAALQEKNVDEICRVLVPIATRFVFPKIRSQRALHPNNLSQCIMQINPLLQYSISANFGAALESARANPERILITGSLHFAGEALATLNGTPDALEDCAQ